MPLDRVHYSYIPLELDSFFLFFFFSQCQDGTLGQFTYPPFIIPRPRCENGVSDFACNGKSSESTKSTKEYRTQRRPCIQHQRSHGLSFVVPFIQLRWNRQVTRMSCSAEKLIGRSLIGSPIALAIGNNKHGGALASTKIM